MRILTFLLSVILLFSCKDAKKEYQSADRDAVLASTDPALMVGKKIVENECYICHNPEASEASMIAPPLVAVKAHYIDPETTKEEFTSSMLSWLNDPLPEKVKMHGAFRKFGIMPYQPYSEEAIEQIAAYIYEAELPQPDWFEEHWQKGHGKGQGKGKANFEQVSADMEEEPYFPNASFYRENGQEVAMAAQGVLGKNLLRAIQAEGTEGAISFCKVRARELTDSVGIMKNVIVKRVSDRPRNPENKATTEETGYIIAFGRQVENQAANQGKIIPILKDFNNDEVAYYAPIVTNAMCLQCHGNPGEEITEPVMLTLRNLYPGDKATGYDAGQVRGMWKIQFVKDPE